MPNKRYERGRRLEWELRKLLIADEYVVTRAAGSHSPFDLIAINFNCSRFIQVKAGSSFDEKEIELLKVFGEANMDTEHRSFELFWYQGRGRWKQYIFRDGGDQYTIVNDLKVRAGRLTPYDYYTSRRSFRASKSKAVYTDSKASRASSNRGPTRPDSSSEEP